MSAELVERYSELAATDTIWNLTPVKRYKLGIAVFNAGGEKDLESWMLEIINSAEKELRDVGSEKMPLKSFLTFDVKGESN